LIAGRHGFSCPPETVSIWVPARLATLRITRQNRGSRGPPESPVRGGKRPRFAPQGHVIGPDLRFRPLGALGKCELNRKGSKREKGSAWGAWNSVAGGPAYVFWDQGMYGFAAARIAPRIPMRPPIVPGWPP